MSGQLTLWEDDAPVILQAVRPAIISTPAEMPHVWLWTARYSNRNITRFELAAVRTTLGHPRFKLNYSIVANLPELAPSREMLGMEDVEAFATAYRAKLDVVGFEAIVERLRALHEQHGRPLAFCCFEDLRKPDLSCHRTQLAAFLGEHGLIVPELRE